MRFVTIDFDLYSDDFTAYYILKFTDNYMRQYFIDKFNIDVNKTSLNTNLHLIKIECHDNYDTIKKVNPSELDNMPTIDGNNSKSTIDTIFTVVNEIINDMEMLLNITPSAGYVYIKNKTNCQYMVTTKPFESCFEDLESDSE